MSEPSPITPGVAEPSLSEELWYPGLAALTEDAGRISLPLIEMTYVQQNPVSVYLLRVRRHSVGQGPPYAAWVERLYPVGDGEWSRPRKLPRTYREAATPWQAATAASVAAGWVDPAEQAKERRATQLILAAAERDKQRAVAEGRHLTAVPTSTTDD